MPPSRYNTYYEHVSCNPITTCIVDAAQQRCAIHHQDSHQSVSQQHCQGAASSKPYAPCGLASELVPQVCSQCCACGTRLNEIANRSRFQYTCSHTTHCMWQLVQSAIKSPHVSPVPAVWDHDTVSTRPSVMTPNQSFD